jgi:hypothetical protein
MSNFMSKNEILKAVAELKDLKAIHKLILKGKANSKLIKQFETRLGRFFDEFPGFIEAYIWLKHLKPRTTINKPNNTAHLKILASKCVEIARRVELNSIDTTDYPDSFITKCKREYMNTYMKFETIIVTAIFLGFKCKFGNPLPLTTFNISQKSLNVVEDLNYYGGDFEPWVGEGFFPEYLERY